MFLREVGGRALLEGTVRPCAGSAELSALAGRKPPAIGVNPELGRALSPAGVRQYGCSSGLRGLGGMRRWREAISVFSFLLGSSPGRVLEEL